MRWHHIQIIFCTCSLHASRITRNPFVQPSKQAQEEILAHVCWREADQEIALIQREGKLVMLSRKKTPSTWES